jgi:hypothetical protein
VAYYVEYLLRDGVDLKITDAGAIITTDWIPRQYIFKVHQGRPGERPSVFFDNSNRVNLETDTTNYFQNLKERLKTTEESELRRSTRENASRRGRRVHSRDHHHDSGDRRGQSSTDYGGNTRASSRGKGGNTMGPPTWRPKRDITPRGGGKIRRLNEPAGNRDDQAGNRPGPRITTEDAGNREGRQTVTLRNAPGVLTLTPASSVVSLGDALDIQVPISQLSAPSSGQPGSIIASHLLGTASDAVTVSAPASTARVAVTASVIEETREPSVEIVWDQATGTETVKPLVDPACGRAPDRTTMARDRGITVRPRMDKKLRKAYAYGYVTAEAHQKVANKATAGEWRDEDIHEDRRRDIACKKMTPEEAKAPHCFGRCKGPWDEDAHERFPELTQRELEAVLQRDYVYPLRRK